MKLTFSIALNLLCVNVLSVELKKVSMFRFCISVLKFSSLGTDWCGQQPAVYLCVKAIIRAGDVYFKQFQKNNLFH